jgi:hypothetical protein
VQKASFLYVFFTIDYQVVTNYYSNFFRQLTFLDMTALPAVRFSAFQQEKSYIERPMKNPSARSGNEMMGCTKWPGSSRAHYLRSKKHLIEIDFQLGVQQY